MDSNDYDHLDLVRREAVIIADGPGTELRLAAYRVRDPVTKEFGKLQFHMTYCNTVMAVMGEEAAKMFCNFVTTTIRPQEPT